MLREERGADADGDADVAVVDHEVAAEGFALAFGHAQGLLETVEEQGAVAGRPVWAST